MTPDNETLFWVGVIGAVSATVIIASIWLVGALLIGVMS